MTELPTNPLIGILPADTLDNCAKVLLIVEMATESQDTIYDDAPIGYQLVFNCVRQALRYESDRGLAPREDNVSKLEVES